MEKQKRRKAELWDSDDDHDVIERNGNLTLVRNRETGEEDYVSPHEIKREW